MAEEEKEVERATYRRALEELKDLPPSNTDPYDGVVQRFALLPPYVRLFLQRLSIADIRTLSRTILNIQRTGAFFKNSRRVIGWSIAAFTAAVIAGEKLSQAFNWLMASLR